MTKVWIRIAPCLLIVWMACSSPVRKIGDYKIALVPSRKGQHGVFVMNSDTTGGKLLTPEASAQLRASSWSPDAKRILYFASDMGDSDLRSKYRTPFHFPLHVMDVGGGNQRRLLDFPVSGFEWSPDSQQLLYISAYEDPDHDNPAVVAGTKAPMSAIYVLDLRTGEHKRLTSFGQNCSGSWSPDGQYLALSFGTERKSDIYKVSPDGQHTWRLTDSQMINTRPVWSPNGKAIAYVSVSPLNSEGQDAGVYVADATGASKRRVTDAMAVGAAWSYDAKMLLLQTATGLTVVDVEGNKLMDLTPPAVRRPLDAVFTPDGLEIMFRSNHEGDWSLYAVSLKGTGLRRITGNLTVSMFCLSPLKQ